MIHRETVEHIARLARLDLTGEEKRLFASQLGAILLYMDKLKGLDTEEIQPFSHPNLPECPFREDASRDSLDRDRALENAPQRERGFFKVPPTFKREGKRGEEDGNP